MKSTFIYSVVRVLMYIYIINIYEHPPIPRCTQLNRTSLRIFAILQQSKHNFEDLCYRYAERQKKQENISIYPFTQRVKDASCGNFVKAFVSLFIEKKEITRLSLNEIIDGSALRQLSNHPNLVLHSILYNICHIV